MADVLTRRLFSASAEHAPAASSNPVSSARWMRDGSGNRHPTRFTRRRAITTQLMASPAFRHAKRSSALRRHFDDPLLLQRGRALVLSAKALQLVEPVSSAAAAVAAVFDNRSRFDSAPDPASVQVQSRLNGAGARFVCTFILFAYIQDRY